MGTKCGSCIFAIHASISLVVFRISKALYYKSIANKQESEVYNTDNTAHHLNMKKTSRDSFYVFMLYFYFVPI